MDNLNLSLSTDTKAPSPDYSILLERFNISFKREDFYWVIGEVPAIQGWILFIPVSILEISLLLEIIVPYLIQNRIAFKIPVDKHAHNNIKEGNWGNEIYGKVICIYPSMEEELVEISQFLIQSTLDISGTSMSSAFHLGGLVYTRYGSFDPITTPNGEFLYDDKGNLKRDNYSIPYSMPVWVRWPFGKISSPHQKPSKKILGSKYFVLDVIRDVPKGRVIHAFYKKGMFAAKHCLIKEGKKGMFSDDQERDISDRLKWQQFLHEKLADKVSIPQFLDYFEEDGSTYLAIEYIKGTKLETYVEEIFLFNSWLELPNSKKNIIIDKLIEIVNVLDSLHKLGYVHRDITPTNFLVDDKGKIYLIDLELSFAVNLVQPNPPYQVGTDGYMSPEQEAAIVLPTYEQDIFSIGALILMVLTRLSPKKFIGTPTSQLKSKLLFFTGSQTLSSMLVNCLLTTPSDRLECKDIISQLLQYKDEINTEAQVGNVDANMLNRVIQDAINSIQLPSMMSSDGYWVSQDNAQHKTRHIYIGFSKGIAGIIFQICTVKKGGFNIRLLDGVINENWSFLKERFLFAGKDVPSGLYQGSAGVALAIKVAIESDVFPMDREHINYISNCLFNVPVTLCWANGMAGYGYVLIMCANVLPDEFVNERISIVINHIINSQLPNGSWRVVNENQENLGSLIGFEEGVAGIVYFLLELTQKINDPLIISAAIRGLNWLRKKAIKSGNGLVWPNYDKAKAGTLFFNGTMGVVLTFIKAFEVTGDIVYKRLAEQGMETLPSKCITNDFSFSEGLSGIGEVYLEAFRVFKDERWIKRAEWLVNVFVNSASGSDKDYYWIQNIIRVPCADLMEGNCAIIHFLNQFSKRSKMDKFYF